MKPYQLLVRTIQTDLKYRRLKFQATKLYIEVFTRLFDLQPETFFTSEIADRLSLTKTPDANGLRQAVSISETYFIEANIDNMGKFDRIKKALTSFGFDDELSFNYTDEKRRAKA